MDVQSTCSSEFGHFSETELFRQTSPEGSQGRVSRHSTGSVGHERSLESLDTSTPVGRKLLRKNTLEAKRAPSHSAALRAELEMSQEQQAKEDGRISFKSCCRLPRFRRPRLGSTFEPKDLDLTALAKKKYGEHVAWHELAVSDQVSIIQDALSSKHWAMNPNSDYMAVWDMIMVFCLVFTAFVTPVEIAFLKPDYNALYVMNRSVDALFIKDMMLQFFIQVQVPTKQGVVWLKRKKDIANAYLRSWFIVDLIAILPYDDISNMMQGGSSSSDISRLKIVRLFRVMRLLKLVRILKASRVLKRWQTRVGFRYVSLYLFQFVSLIAVACHWMACIWGFFGMLEGTKLECRETLSRDDPRLKDFPDRMYFVEGTSVSELDPYDPQQWVGVSWIVSFAAERVAESTMDPCAAISMYMASVYWAIMTMTSIGYGDIVPLTISEYLVSTVCMLVSSILWAYIISAGCGIVMTMNPEGQEFEKRIDAFNAMAKGWELPTHIRHLGREYIRAHRYHQRFLRNQKTMESCGRSWKASVAKISTDLYLKDIWFFKQACTQLKSDIVRAMEPHFYERRVLVKQHGKLCVVEHGSLGRGGRVLVPFNYWGDDILLSYESLRLEKLCSTLTYTELLVLSRDNLSVVLLDYPAELGFLRRCAACIALIRMAYIYRQQETRVRERSPDLEWMRGIFERARTVGQNAMKEAMKRQTSPIVSNGCDAHQESMARSLGEVEDSITSRLELMQAQLARMEESLLACGFGEPDHMPERRMLISL